MDNDSTTLQGHRNAAQHELPRLAELGPELTATTKRQRTIALVRPFVGVCCYALAASFELWWLLPVLMFLIFVAVVTVTHDVVHGVLGLSSRQTDLALFVLGAILLESGHAYRLTHLQHHRMFPEPDDPEGDPARMGLVGAIFHGVVFLPRLWVWAFRQSRGTGQRPWLVAEAAWAIGFVVAAIVISTWTSSVLTYAGLAIIGSWVYPLLTVHLPHRNYGNSPLTQTHTLRGWLIPKLFLELTYHLEHHLYPAVPSHNLAKLSKRLDPHLQRAGVIPRRVP